MVSQKSIQVLKDNGQVVISDLDPTICDLLCEKITESKFKNKKTIYCQGIVLATPKKSSGSADSPESQQGQHSVQSLQPSAANALGKKNSFITHSNKDKLGQAQPNGLAEIGNNDDEYVFNDLQQSKFFRKTSESESDDFDNSLDNEDDKWMLKSNKRKKKNMLTNKVAIKKVNNKTTPESKKK